MIQKSNGYFNALASFLFFCFLESFFLKLFLVNKNCIIQVSRDCSQYIYRFKIWASKWIATRRVSLTVRNIAWTASKAQPEICRLALILNNVHDNNYYNDHDNLNNDRDLNHLNLNAYLLTSNFFRNIYLTSLPERDKLSFQKELIVKTDVD